VKRRLPSWQTVLDALIPVLGIALALAVRYTLLDFKSVDYFSYTKPWYLTLKSSGFAGFGADFSNYNLPYLYVLYVVIRLLPDAAPWVAIKLPSIAADFLAAWFAFRIVRLQRPHSSAALLAAFGILFAPTVILNSAYWGQADSIYACALLGCLYFLLRHQDFPAMLLLGIAFAFKAQAVFLAPFILGLLLRGELRWRSTLVIPAVYLLALVPALAAGRPLLDLLLIYPAQANQYERLTLHAPSALAWIPDTGRFYPFFYPAGLIAAATGAILLVLGMVRQPGKMSLDLQSRWALAAVVLTPFLLPKMHERYFYVADLMSIVVVFLRPRLLALPVLMLTVSFFAYQPTLFGVEPVPMSILALGVLAVIVILFRDIGAEIWSSALAASNNRAVK
jgi:Gpi18-like mannosyltransferase